MTKAISDFICFNQGQLIQYEYLIAQTHANLKDFLNHLNCSNNDKNNIDIASINVRMELIELLTDVYTTCETNLKILLQQNISKINTIFDLKDFNFTVELLDFENNQYNKYNFYNSDFTFEENQNSDFPSESLTDNSIYTKLIFNNERDYKKENIVIIPMTLRNNEDLSDEFKQNFFKGSASHIWGFITIRSSENFSQKDIDLAHIITDIISLYFIFFHDHTEGSQSFNKAIELLNTKN